MYRRSAALADDPNGVGSRRLSGEIASTRFGVYIAAIAATISSVPAIALA
jgi:hypothetical protein